MDRFKWVVLVLFLRLLFFVLRFALGFILRLILWVLKILFIFLIFLIVFITFLLLNGFFDRLKNWLNFDFQRFSFQVHINEFQSFLVKFYVDPNQIPDPKHKVGKNQSCQPNINHFIDSFGVVDSSLNQDNNDADNFNVSHQYGHPSQKVKFVYFHFRWLKILFENILDDCLGWKVWDLSLADVGLGLFEAVGFIEFIWKFGGSD